MISPSAPTGMWSAGIPYVISEKGCLRGGPRVGILNLAHLTSQANSLIPNKLRRTKRYLLSLRQWWKDTGRNGKAASIIFRSKKRNCCCPYYLGWYRWLFLGSALDRFLWSPNRLAISDFHLPVTTFQFESKSPISCWSKSKNFCIRLKGSFTRFNASSIIYF